MKYEPDAGDMARDLDALLLRIPTAEQAERQADNRKAALGLVGLFRQNCPPSPELELAVQFVRNGVLWASAAIIVHERPSPDEALVADPRPAKPGAPDRPAPPRPCP